MPGWIRVKRSTFPPSDYGRDSFAHLCTDWSDVFVAKLKVATRSPSPFFARFLLFSQKVEMVQTFTMPHFKALILSNIFLKGQRCGKMKKAFFLLQQNV